MDRTKVQFIIVAGGAAIVLLFFLIFQGILPGRQKDDSARRQIEAELSFWTVFDKEDPYDTTIKLMEELYPRIDIRHKSFRTVAEYKQALLEALAIGQGPDIFMIENGSLTQEEAKIAPAPSTAITVAGVRKAFPKVVEKDFIRGGRIYALPTSIDTLALIYNRTYLNQRAVVFPPETWEELQSLVPQLVDYGAETSIKKAAAAVGGTPNTIDKAGDLLGLLQIQYGEAGGLNVLKTFQNPADRAYTWNEDMPYSLDAFANGQVGMIFNYQSALPKIRKKNSILDIQIAPMLQKEGGGDAKSLARYWGYTVSRQSRNQGAAWDLVLQLTTNAFLAESYMLSTGRPPALNLLIEQKLDDPDQGIFARQALIADSITDNQTEALENELLHSLPSAK